MGVKAVVFDVGNVLYHWDIGLLYEDLIPDREKRDWFLANVVTTEWHFQHDAGRPLAEMVAERTALYPEHRDLIAAYPTGFLKTIPGPVAGSLELVAELSARGVPIFGITNFGDEFWQMFRPAAPVFDHFQDIVVSGVEKLVKPDHAIYRLALKRFGLAPGEGIFVDDRLENVEAATANGFAGHHFDNAADLRSALVRIGLL
jgi:2-haloacid dehalogenase